MKIQLFIMTFLFALASIAAPSYQIVKGSVYGVSTNYDVIERADSKVNASAFEKGTQIHLTEGWGITTLRDKGNAHMFFSSKMHVWLSGKTTLWIDNFEQFIDKDENGKTIIDDGSFCANLRLNGSADFKLKAISDSGYFNIITNGADLNVRSKHFYVLTELNFTTIECYEGTVEFTNSENIKETTILKAGESAYVWGRNGGMNLSVKITPLTEEQKAKAKARLTDSEEPEWKFGSSSPEKK
jgi:hypothetical protein